MTNAVLLMLLTGLVWTAVGVLFGAAPSERNRLYSFFATGNLVFCAFALAMRPPSATMAAKRRCDKTRHPCAPARTALRKLPGDSFSCLPGFGWESFMLDFGAFTTFGVLETTV